MLPLIPVIGGLLKTVGGIFGAWQKRKLVSAEGKIALEKALVDGKIKQVQTAIDNDQKIDLMATRGMMHSWKDEWFTILLSIPVIMAFIPVPEIQALVATGFQILKDDTPEWYQYCFIGAIVASFGIRSFINKRG
jgi:hypothetical protein